MLGSKLVNNLKLDLESLMNEKARFNIALKRYVNTYSFYTVHEFLLPEK
jgi:hypothetical protein